MFDLNKLPNISETELSSYVTPEDVFLEGMTSISALIGALKSQNSINDRKIKLVVFDASRLKSKRRELVYLLSSAEQLGFKVFLCDTLLVDNYSQGKTHGGVLALCSKRTIPALAPQYITDGGFYAYIEGVEDPYNFGYSIRALYAAGVDGIILTERNWLSAAGIVARSSAGASEALPMYCADGELLCRHFKNRGYSIVAASIRDSVSLYDADLTKPLLLIVGGEKRGISRLLLDNSDLKIRIEYANDFRGSLPTVSAVSVIAFEIYKQNK